MRKIHKVFDSSKVENWEVCLRVQRSKPLRKYKGEFPQLNESAVRLMWQKYEEELRQSLKEKREPKTKFQIPNRIIQMKTFLKEKKDVGKSQSDVRKVQVPFKRKSQTDVRKLRVPFKGSLCCEKFVLFCFTKE